METQYPDSPVIGGKVNTKKVMELTRHLLQAIGENPDRPGLVDTPRRVANFWQEFIAYEPGTVDTVFESHHSNQLVIVQGIRLWSLCEHHLLPFWCDVTIGYIPNGQVLGLSKFARIAQQMAHGLQVQERLVGMIAQAIKKATSSPDVAVTARGQHLCMMMRGVRQEATMVTSDLSGKFFDNPTVRAEFLALAMKE